MRSNATASKTNKQSPGIIISLLDWAGVSTSNWRNIIVLEASHHLSVQPSGSKRSAKGSARFCCGFIFTIFLFNRWKIHNGSKPRFIHHNSSFKKVSGYAPQTGKRIYRTPKGRRPAPGTTRGTRPGQIIQESISGTVGRVGEVSDC